MEPWRPQFVFAVCQHGAEGALKKELASRAPHLRPAFSRPGFVTFKIDESASVDADNFSLPSTFARTAGWSLGSVKGEMMADLARQVWELPQVVQFLAAHKIAGLHVWQRDEREPGERGFEPGVTPLADDAEQALRDASPVESLRLDADAEPPTIPRHRWVLDVILVEPNHWCVGCHKTSSRIATWVGGTPTVDMPDYAVSRAYLKMAESLAWSSLPMSKGEGVIELGCAPGGASQALLDAGLEVIGVDPAEVDESVLAHSRFTHVRARTLQVPKKAYRGVRWLAADMNVAPTYTLDAVEAAVKQAGVSIRGLLLTLKLADWALAEELPAYIERVKSWGYRDVRVRQLAFNRQEVCLAALRSRSQRRVLRTGGQRHERRDPPHSRVPAPHGPEPQI